MVVWIMKKNMATHIWNRVFLMLVIIFFVLSLSFQFCNTSVYASNEESIPEPIKIVDFSNSFEDLSMLDEEFEVVDNAVKPELVEDSEMGQVLKLNKTIAGDKEYDDLGNLVEDHSVYSTIKISNPYKGLEYLKEYEPYEDVKTTVYNTEIYNTTFEHVQPKWENGITISYWINCPEGVNSNVLGFTSEMFQIEAQDYAYYLCTVKFDLEYNSYSDEERTTLNFNESGVDKNSAFYFEYVEGETYMDKPLYVSEDKMGSMYWMNKNYVPGYIQNDDGTYRESKSDASYDYYHEAPRFGDTEEDHDYGTSYLRYGWTASEMWLDSSSSFYFTNEIGRQSSIQLNRNRYDSWKGRIGLQDYNTFYINSWRNAESFETALSNKCDMSKSPSSLPNKWHYITVVIQNDWVRFYFDGEQIDVLNEYSSAGYGTILEPMMTGFWKQFNKGTGARYGFGVVDYKGIIGNCLSGNYVSTTMLEWLAMDCTDLMIGGGSIEAFDNIGCMADGTDEILIKNIVFYDQMLTDDQIKELSEDPFYYQQKSPLHITGDVDGDGSVDAKDALLVLKHAAKIELLENAESYDVSGNGSIDADDALIILKYAAKLIDAI